MLKHYLKVSFRSIVRHRGFSLINIVGLAIGMACCVLILLWIQNEVSVDQFHENGDDVYMVAAWARYGSRVDLTSNTPPGLPPVLVSEYPDIIRSTRFNRASGLITRYGERSFVEQFTAVDPDFLEMFSFPLVRGNVDAALEDPHSIVMTEREAEKYFGNDDPLGKVIDVDGIHQFTVTGILKDIPDNSSLKFSMLIPFVALADLWNDPGYPTTWSNWSNYSYVQLREGVSSSDVVQQIVHRVDQDYPEAKTTLFLARYSEMYLYGWGPVSGRIRFVVILGLIGLVILMVACLNFMNITTARSSTRAREIGLRKVAGAGRRDIVYQFYGEAFLLTLLSMIVASVLAELFLPVFNGLINENLSFEVLRNPMPVIGLGGVALLTGLISGSYPALYMAAFRPVKIFRGLISSGPKKSRFRSGFVVWQFAVSVILVMATLVIDKQVKFAQNRDLGYERENIVYFQLKKELKTHRLDIKRELLQHGDILHVAAVSHLPSGIWTNGSGWHWEGRSEAENPLVTYLTADTDFLETFGASMARGRYFSKDRPDVSSVQSGEVVINERFARIMGLEEPIGVRLSDDSRDFTVIGVVKDFHFKSLHHRMGPLMVFQKTFSNRSPDRYNYLVAKLRPGSETSAVEHIRTVCDKYSPGFPLTVGYLEDDLDVLYGGERQFGKVITYAAGLMIFIAGLGLFGLAAFTVERRTKEIGIRKVLGASLFSILRMLGRQMLIPVLIANGIAWVISYFLMSGYLISSFAYRTAIGWQPLVWSAVLTLGVALVSISFQAVRAARTDPIESLRYE